MSDPNTVRILSINGGGMRGYMPLIFLQRFLTQWGMVGTIAENFDVISGTSVGGIGALSFGLGKSVSQVIPFFTEEGQWIFTIRSLVDELGTDPINASTPGNRPNEAQRFVIFTENGFFYESVDITSNYGSAKLKSVLSSVLGSNTMADMQTNILVTSFDATNSKPVFFSNVNLTGYKGHTELALNVGLATSAAPIYLPPPLFGGKTYLDGGIYQNNPAQAGLTLARRIKPTANRACLLSLGTGRNLDYYDNTSIINNLPLAGGALNLLNVLSASLNGSADTIATDLLNRSEYTLENLFYYDFNPILDTENQDIGLDNSDPSFLTYMSDTANTWYDNDQAAITEFIGHLNA